MMYLTVFKQWRHQVHKQVQEQCSRVQYSVPKIHEDFNFDTLYIFSHSILSPESIHTIKNQIWPQFQQYVNLENLNFILYKVKKSTSSEKKVCLTKVAPNDPSYCSKFFLFWRNLKNKAARAKKPSFLPLFLKTAKNMCFLALAAIFLRFRQNKKNLEQ